MVSIPKSQAYSGSTIEPRLNMTALGTLLERFCSTRPRFESLEVQIVHRKFPSAKGADSIRREIGRRRTEGFASRLILKMQLQSLAVATEQTSVATVG